MTRTESGRQQRQNPSPVLTGPPHSRSVLGHCAWGKSESHWRSQDASRNPICSLCFSPLLIILETGTIFRYSFLCSFIRSCIPLFIHSAPLSTYHVPGAGSPKAGSSPSSGKEREGKHGHQCHVMQELHKELQVPSSPPERAAVRLPSRGSNWLQAQDLGSLGLIQI